MSKPNQSQEQDASILRLPTNILLLIYTKIRSPATQIFFALSCRALARIAKLADLNRDNVRGFNKYRPYGLLDFMRALHVWVDPSLQLCHSCLKYLPVQRKWKDRQGRDITTLRRVDWLWAVKCWISGGRNCPTCQIPQDYDESREWVQCRPESFVRVVMVQHPLPDT